MKDGYIRVYNPSHPNAVKGGYVLEHRKIMADHLGRPLLEDEIIHHVNGDTTDNRIENLRIITRKGHASKHDREREYNKAWTEEENRLLRELWPANISKEKVLLEFDRTWIGIKVQARKLGLRRPPIQHRGIGRSRKQRRDSWKPHDEMLRKLWPHASKKEILGAFPNRSWNAIKHRAYDIRLEKGEASI